ncbi:MAG: glycoside hydrolase family 3 N-terminal domain-containing protein [Bacillota bacterium]
MESQQPDLSGEEQKEEGQGVKEPVNRTPPGPSPRENQEVVEEGTSMEEESAAESAFLPKEDDVEKMVANMTLEEKIGQLLVVGFSSKQVDNHIQTMIKEYKVGGVILYDRNMESREQVTQLTKNLQGLALENNQQIPLMITIDQEGGQIVRMREHVAVKPSQQELGIRGDAQAVYETNNQTGEELKEMGITVNHAPVLDLSATDSRSFGEDPKKAEALGKQAIKGLNDAGITATIKHFPGNGRSNVDPHYETSSVEAEQLDLENKDIYPFRRVIDDMDHNQFFVMVTHLKYPAYDEENPASISHVIIQNLLREKLGYKGLIVTDDLEMGAVNKYFTYKDLGYSAVDAGNDLLLVCHTFESQKQVIEGIHKAVKTNKLTEERIDESVKRILTYKMTES